MSRTCPLCDAALTDAEEIDRGCARKLAGQLRAIPALLDELDTSLARSGSNWSEPGGLRGRATGGCKPGCDHTPDNPSCIEGVTIEVNLAASEATAQLRLVLHGWARVWDEQTPLGDPRIRGPLCGNGRCTHQSCAAIDAGLRWATERARRDRALGTAARQALLLASQPLAARPWAPDVAREIQAAVRAAEHAIDTPPETTLVGTCTCGMGITAPTGAALARCRWCGADWDVAASRQSMLDAAVDVVAPAARIERALGPDTVTAAQIRGWRHRGALAQAIDDDGQPIYTVSGQPCYSLAAVAKLAREGAPRLIEQAGHAR